MVSTAAMVESVTSLWRMTNTPSTTMRVVDAGDDDARREPQVEAEREVEHDEDDRDGDRVARAVAELLAGLGADPLDAERPVGDACRRRAALRSTSMSWSPLLWSWISTRWSRGFTTCGFVGDDAQRHARHDPRPASVIFARSGSTS